MDADFLNAVDERSAGARASGDLLPIQAEETVIEDAGLRFIVRWVS
ncbi:MAG: phosphorylase, partial [Zoogloeaceae bacterium]|nr:phosphorylase [Zoogloeaceae bacterium]